jgi:hypothetical protein
VNTVLLWSNSSDQTKIKEFIFWTSSSHSYLG